MTRHRLALSHFTRRGVRWLPRLHGRPPTRLVGARDPRSDQPPPAHRERRGRGALCITSAALGPQVSTKSHFECHVNLSGCRSVEDSNTL